jgi:hypothetical protein
MTFSHFLAGLPLDGMAAESRYDVIVGTIEDVSKHKPTNGTPPIVTLRVQEVLRGEKESNRTRGWWAPFSHDVDWSGDEADALINKWAATPMQLPEVGAKKILFGEMDHRDDQAVFWISPVGRFDYSDKNRELALQGIEQFEIAARQAEQRRAAEEQAYAKKMKVWRAKYSSADIERFTQAAEFVGIGTVCSGPQSEDAGDYYDFAVSEILKGQRRRNFTGDVYYVTALVPATIGELLSTRDRAFVLFLSDEHAQFGDARDYYVPISAGDGMLEADAEAVRAARAAIDK